MRDQFVTDFIQGGAGTSTNMNANEVIANLALEALGHKKGEYQYVNPERSRELRAVDQRRLPDRVPPGADPAPASYMDALRRLQERSSPRQGVRRVLKMGRTHLQDAVPMSLGQEFPRLGHDDRRGSAAHRRSPPVPARDQPRRHRDRHDGDGAPGYPELATKYLSELTGRSSSWPAT
jgi:aspartate ammonia-lyase